jgi:hypothetical protein
MLLLMILLLIVPDSGYWMLDPGIACHAGLSRPSAA